MMIEPKKRRRMTQTQRFNRWHVATLLVARGTVTKAAAEAGLGESTVRRWLRLPGFARMVARLRREVLHDALATARQLLLRSLTTLEALMTDPNPCVRLGA